MRGRQVKKGLSHLSSDEKEQIIFLYEVEKLWVPEIAKCLGRCITTINRFLRLKRIKRRKIPPYERTPEIMAKYCIAQRLNRSRKISPLKGRKRPAEVCAKMSAKARRGEKSRFWRGGVHKSGYTYEFILANKRGQRLRDLLIERANGKCQLCGINVLDQKRFAHRHHVNQDKLDNRIENLIIVCPRCHIKIHKSANMRQK